MNAERTTSNSSAWALQPAGKLALLDADPDLATGLTEVERVVARRIQVVAYRLRRGPLTPLGGGGHSFGLLIARGLLMREVIVAGRPAAELLGRGDLIRPWPRRDREVLLDRQLDWTVVEQAIVVDVNRGLVQQLAATPSLVDSLLERGFARADRLLLDRAIAAHVRVDVRLLACLWHLAERWGVATPAGVRVDLPLTHAVLARIVGARRPTVTTAFQRLMLLGHVHREGRTFVLTGDASSVHYLDRHPPSRDVVANDAAPAVA